ncbi:hypothetical protein NLJ89_g6078 [Agrocybe chaxingu]|uniref:Uncharacterized protein n=1 Tax=Agrocybe chaxingu TaxID=84603 RepID=A0A9W8JZC6_9AGAR|nr:hypothetical protein NLJ89_g6078 [Agrocybe chaxingu]
MESSDPKKRARLGRDEKEKEKVVDFAMTCSHCLKFLTMKTDDLRPTSVQGNVCQKADWSFHRRDCCETQPQFNAVIKFIHRVNKNDFLMKKIGLAVTHEMKSPTDKPAPDPTSAFLSICIGISLRPTSDADLHT